MYKILSICAYRVCCLLDKYKTIIELGTEWICNGKIERTTQIDTQADRKEWTRAKENVSVHRFGLDAAYNINVNI